MKPTPTDTDGELMRRMARGDEEAFQDLYERHARGVMVFLIHQVNDPQLAEELLNDTMLACWNGAATFRGESSARTWLLTIARNRAKNAIRSQSRAALRHRQGTIDDRDAAEHIAAEQLDIFEALDRLPSDQKTALMLVFYQGLPAVDVAEVMGVRPGTVRSWLHRAKATLRHTLDSQGSGDA